MNQPRDDHDTNGAAMRLMGRAEQLGFVRIDLRDLTQAVEDILDGDAKGALVRLEEAIHDESDDLQESIPS